ncbi:F-box/kelch-repeat protein At1g67480-like [Zingiber officinale]|uniref:F-box domain-containing protein n=1 Tax=Zingiber officinale TaxID=94328 RepID=A0A8J5H5M9_ZINOF|nr:F-box/kelch-repeat protein At1g67480-like [Zingiber officinale]XP_042385385.1 F-box/kelch-repeat protein At1g67480-like [Zingiber officinale]XP_042385386.1 F-box/kelch-repeat protein At1g67480-like [Zingiber officinale]XP_042385387.1 F-box/kelch-repeat protein At1g67480-like [Zingiber officinale]KAG6512809.1 hypothetical protein ZIOFF_030938 [Zingiber officinale]
MLDLAMPGFFGVQKRLADAEVRLNVSIQSNLATQKFSAGFSLQAQQNPNCPIIPGLPDDVAKFCLVLLPRKQLPVIGAVCKRWRSFIKSKEFLVIRKEAGKIEEWLYILTGDLDGSGNHWEVLSGLGDNRMVLPPMPGSKKAGFGIAVIDAYLFVIAGYSVDIGKECVSNDVYQYDSRLNRWSTLTKMNIARCDFACAELDGFIYAVGGIDSHGDCLSSVEVYDPSINKWTIIESLRCPRWGCFACSFEDKLYVMGGRSSFTIGNTKFVNVYHPESHSWNEMRSGCVMVTAHAVLDNKLFCIEWKNQRKLAIFNPVDSSWNKVPVPVTGSSSIAFRFGIFNHKLLLFALEETPGYQTLLYDPDAPVGSEWQRSSLKPSGLCLCSVTIKA